MRFLTDLSVASWRRPALGSSGPGGPEPEPGPVIPALGYAVDLRLFEATQVFNDLAGTTPAATGGAVARVNGLGTAPTINATQATVASRPTRRTGGDLTWVEYDGIDDRMIVAADAAFVQNGQSLVVVMRAQTSVAHIALLGNAGTSGTAIAGYLSQTASPTAAATSFGAGNYYKNGALVGSNISRTTAYSAYVTGGWVIVEIAGLDLIGTAIASQGAQFPGWRSRTAELGPVDIGAWLILPTATLNTGTNRADLVAALAGHFGITP